MEKVTRDMIRQMRKLDQQIKGLKKEYEALQKQVKACGPNRYVYADGGLLVYTSTSTKFDKSQFKKDYPGLIDPYEETSTNLCTKFI